MKPLKLNIQFFADDHRIGVEFDVNMTAAKKALQILNNEVKKSEYAWKAYAAETEDWEDTSEGLQKKVDALTDKQKKQKEIVENLSKQYKASEERYGENHKLTSRLAKDYEAAKYELAKTNTELKDYTKKLDDANDETDDLSKATDDLEGKFTVLKSTMSQLIADGLKKLASVAIDTAREMVNVGISFESSFAGVRKTVDATEEEFADLKNEILDMSTRVASSADSIAEVMEMAGQLGIANENLTSFTETMIMLGDSTNMNAGEAAETLARFANITNMSQSDFEKLGSTLVELGNNYATTEGEIMTMALRLAGAGEQVGMTETDILGLATALSSVGIEAEMGGTALSKAMVKAENATALSGTKLNKVLKQTGMSLHEITILQKNSKQDFNALATSLDMTSTELSNLVNAGNDLEHFAEISGMTSEEFTKAWEEDASGALIKFIQGLGDTTNASENAITMLSEMGITEVRLRDSLVRAANASGLFEEAIRTSSEAWQENTALVTEAERRYETVESQLQMAKNELIKVGIAIYDRFREPLVKALNAGRESIKKFAKQLESKEMTEAIDTIAKGVGKFVTSLIEFAAKVIPKVLSGIAKLIKNWDKLKPIVYGATAAIVAYKVANFELIGGMKTGNFLIKAGSGLFGLLTGKIKLATTAQKLFTAAQAATPWGLVAVGIGAVVAATVALKDANKKAKPRNEELTKALKNQKEAIDEINESLDEQEKRYEELEETRQEAINEGLSEIEQIQRLKDELDLLVDADGNVKKGYEARVDYILNELNNALGTEMSLTGGVIKNYKDMQKEIDKLIAKEKAYVVFEAYKPEYEEAIKREKEALQTLNDAQKVYDEADATYKQAQIDASKAKSDLKNYAGTLKPLTGKGRTLTLEELLSHYHIDATTGTARETDQYISKEFSEQQASQIFAEVQKYAQAVGDVYAASKSLGEAKLAVDEAGQAFADNLSTQVDYQAISALIAAGNYEEAMARMNTATRSTAQSTASELKTSADNLITYLDYYDQMINGYREKGDLAAAQQAESQKKVFEQSLKDTMTYLQQQSSTIDKTAPEVIEAWKNLAQNSNTEYLAFLESIGEDQAKVIQDLVGTTKIEGENVVNEWSTLVSSALSQITGKNVYFKDAGNGMVQAVIDGKEEGEKQSLDAMAQFAADLVTQVKDKKIDAETAGEMLVNGVNNGISDEHKQQAVLGNISSFAKKIVGKLKSAWEIKSPSRVSKGLAEYFMEGIAKGFESKENPLLNKIRNIGNEITSSLQGELNQNDLTSKVGDLRNELNSTLQEKLGAIKTSVNGTVSLGADTSTLNEIGQIQTAGSKIVIINQTNNSPKSLDRLEIWRQTHNAAQLAARS